ncbi:beta-ketoacyl-ACP synthase II [Raoultibacter phocaeensis]|uniref:beta-ketoacyl-ACP synthase II n=1 Tax=Raoultibacter phocaeensis TaxID=2479841 RepID=UPI00111B9150|nr:beta-ketoacyl-ACP synthase II [Raoultibacter phocaeensis]
MSVQDRSNVRTPDGCNRVVITGTGAISPAGVGVEALWQAVMEARCCIGPLTRFPSDSFDVKIAGEIPAYDPLALGLTKKEAHRLARFVQYAFIASDEAWAQAGIAIENEDATRIGCVFGSGIGGLEAFEQGSVTLNTKGPKRVIPLFIPTVISNMAAGNLSIRFGLKGECTNIVTACATGTHCIGAAYRSIKHGYLDAALAGGTEESVTPVSLAGFSNLGALTKPADPHAASVPFDKRRSGFVAGEGAGAVVLESLDHARARGAHIIAEIVGFGSTGDAYHMTAPEPDGEGLVRAMRLALEEGGFGPEDIGHLNAHGTSTPANDKAEAQALIGLCGKGCEVPVVSIKGSTGHMLGGAGAVEAIVCARSVVEGVVPATTGFSEPDPACPVRVLREPLRDYSQKVALSNSLGFGGHNASLAIAPYCG